MSESDLQFLLDPRNFNNDEYMHAEVWFYNGHIQEVITDVGIRVLGSTTKVYAKKSWKLSFSTFVSGRRWYQLKHLALKSAVYDPSYIREMASVAVDYSMASPIYRTSYGEVFINNVSWGLYVVSEVMDNQFFKSRMGSDETPVYKTNLGANFSYFGSDPQIYATLNCTDGLCYEPESDQAEDYTRLAEFLEILNLTPDKDFATAIETVLDVDSFLRTYVMEVATSNWDGVADYCNNIYLYLNEKNKFVYWRHDLDLSYGWPAVIDLPMKDMSEVNPYSFTDNVLPVRILNVPSYRAKYTSYFWDLLDAYFQSEGPLMNRIQEFHDLVRPVAVNDLYHQISMGFSEIDFEISLYSDIGSILGVSNFMERRINTLKSTLNPK